MGSSWAPWAASFSRLACPPLFDELNLWGPFRISQGKVSPTISNDKLLLSFPLQMFEVVGGRRLILSDLVHLGQRLILSYLRPYCREAREFACRSRAASRRHQAAIQQKTHFHMKFSNTSGENRANFFLSLPLQRFAVVVVVGAAADEVMTHFHFQIPIPPAHLVTAALTFSQGDSLAVALQLVSAMSS